MNVVPNSALPELSSRKSDNAVADKVSPHKKSRDDTFSKFLDTPEVQETEPEIDSVEAATVSATDQPIPIIPFQVLNLESITAAGPQVEAAESVSEVTDLLPLADTRIEPALNSLNLASSENSLNLANSEPNLTPLPQQSGELTPLPEILPTDNADDAVSQTPSETLVPELARPTNDIVTTAEDGIVSTRDLEPNNTAQISTSQLQPEIKTTEVVAAAPEINLRVTEQTTTDLSTPPETPIDASEAELVDRIANQDLVSNQAQAQPESVESPAQNVQTESTATVTQDAHFEPSVKDERTTQILEDSSDEISSPTSFDSEFTNGESNESFSGTDQNTDNSELPFVSRNANESSTINHQASNAFSSALQDVSPQTTKVDAATSTQATQELSAPTSQLKIAILANAASIEQESTNTIQVDLHPAELGRLQIRIEQTGDQLHAKIIATEIASSELLMHDKQHLVEALDELGFGETSLDITHGGSGEQEPEEESQSLFPQNGSKNQNADDGRLNQHAGVQSASSVGINFVA